MDYVLSERKKACDFSCGQRQETPIGVLLKVASSEAL